MVGMWTKEHRARQLAFERGRRYPTALTDAEWEQVRPLLPKPARRGRTPGVDLREMLNAIRYMARSGGGWRMLPVHFGPWQTVHDVMLMLDREQAGREGADVQDAAGAEAIVKGVRRRWPWLKHLFADGAFDRGRLLSLAAYKDFTLEVIRKLADQKGFQALPRRWVVKRTFGWMTRWRRLVRDYEKLIDVSNAMIQLSMRALLLRRVAHPDT